MRKMNESDLIRPVYESLFRLAPNSDKEIPVYSLHTTKFSIDDHVMDMMRFIIRVDDECAKILSSRKGVSQKMLDKYGGWYFIKKQLKYSCEDISEVILNTSFNLTRNITMDFNDDEDEDNFEFMDDSESFKKTQPLLEYVAIHFYMALPPASHEEITTVNDVYKILQKKYNLVIKYEMPKDYKNYKVTGDFILTDFNAGLLLELANRNYDIAEQFYDDHYDAEWYPPGMVKDYVIRAEKLRNDVVEYIKENKVKSE